MATAVSKSQQAQTASSVEESFSAPSTSSAQAETSSSSLETHPDANPKTTESTCCLVSCFVGIKNCFVGFFEWLCSLFSSTDGSTDAEFEKILKTAPAYDLAALDRVPADELAVVKFGVVAGIINNLSISRYKKPVGEEQAWLYLFDIFTVSKPTIEFGKTEFVRVMDEKIKGKPTLEQILQVLSKSKPSMVEFYKLLQTPMLTTLTKDQRGEAEKMIKEAPVSVFTGMKDRVSPPVLRTLIAFANRVRGVNCH